MTIMIIGEAWGKEEEEARRPFVGPSGRILNWLLTRAGISREDCYVSNVFNVRPQPRNDVSNLCGPKASAIPGYPALQSGKYVDRKYAPELVRLFKEINEVDPTLIIAAGATPAWALLGTSGIRKIRGAPLYTAGQSAEAVGRRKVLPTYHPAAVMRDWTLHPIVIADLIKARRESEYPDIRRPHREIWIEPDLADLYEFERQYIDPSSDLSIDIETAGRQITCIGFAPSADRAIVVPFTDRVAPDGNYWKTPGEERAALQWVKKQCSKSKRVVMQNGLYDANFLWTEYGITIPGMALGDDTMLLHHALQPELEKGLAFLGTIYTDEPQWKFMRTKHETLKQED